MKKWYNRNYLSFEDFIETVDDTRTRDRISNAYYIAAKYYDEETIDFNVSERAKAQYIIFNIHNNNLYRNGENVTGELQYNIFKNNFVDWSTHQVINVNDFLKCDGDNEKIFAASEYAAWTDKNEEGRLHPTDGFIG